MTIAFTASSCVPIALCLTRHGLEDVEKRLEERLGEHFKGVQHYAEQAVDEADSRWEEHILDAKDELKSFVQDEVKEVEDTIKDDLRSVRASVLIDFP